MKETNRVLGGLNRAENAMWSWMHGFGTFDSIPEVEKKNFLVNSKREVSDMQDMMVASIQEAKDFLAQNPLQPDEIEQ